MSTRGPVTFAVGSSMPAPSGGSRRGWMQDGAVHHRAGRLALGLLLSVAVLAGCGASDVPSEPAAAIGADGSANPADAGAEAGQGARTRVYVTLFTHNGPSTPAELAADTRSDYLAYRKTLVEVATLVLEKHAAWDYQVNWLGAVRHAQWETSDVVNGTDYGNTSGQNIVKYLATRSPRVAVGMTSHSDTGLSMLDSTPGSTPVDSATLAVLGLSAADRQTTWNYADIAHVVEGLGAPQQSYGILGGFLASRIDGALHTYWQTYLHPVTGNVYPGVTFTPKVLAFGGTGGLGHVGERASSGVWHPSAASTSLDDFFTDDPSQAALINIGNYNTGTHGSAELLDKLLAMLRAGQLPQNRIYTVSFFTNDIGTTSDKLVPAISTLVDKYRPFVESGDMVWSTLEGISDAWQKDYSRATSVWLDEATR